MRAAIVLPCRLESTRLPRKLLLDRTGKTLLEHTLEKALIAQRKHPELFTQVIAACDDSALIAAAARAGVHGVMTSKEHRSGTDRIAEVAAALDEEIIVNLQADEPEMEPERLELVARALLDNDPRTPMSTMATPIYDTSIFNEATVVKVVVDNRGHALYFSRAPIPFVRDKNEWLGSGRPLRLGLHHFGLYAYRREFLLRYAELPVSELEQREKLEQLRVLDAGYRIKVVEVPSGKGGIDAPDDYEAFVRRQCETSSTT